MTSEDKILLKPHQVTYFVLFQTTFPTIVCLQSHFAAHTLLPLALWLGAKQSNRFLSWAADLGACIVRGVAARESFSIPRWTRLAAVEVLKRGASSVSYIWTKTVHPSLSPISVGLYEGPHLQSLK